MISREERREAQEHGCIQITGSDHLICFKQEEGWVHLPTPRQGCCDPLGMEGSGESVEDAGFWFGRLRQR